MMLSNDRSKTKKIKNKKKRKYNKQGSNTSCFNTILTCETREYICNLNKKTQIVAAVVVKISSRKNSK